MNSPAGLVLPYGAHPDQWVRVAQQPGDDDPRGCAVLVHGGYWRERFTAELMEPLAGLFLEAGWAVANVEYRRGPDAVWPAPLDDVVAACRVVRDWAAQPPGAPAGPLVVVGHSVGGQLALLAPGAGAPVDAVVALAPVTDAARTHAEGLGEDAAAEYFRASPEEAPDRYADASPLRRPVPDVPTLVVHGADDDRVPISHTLDHLAAAWTAGADVDAHLPGRLGHRACIDPDAPHWPAVLGWLARR